MPGGVEPSDDLRTQRLDATVRRASTVLKVVAVLLAVGAVVASAISATTDLNQFYGGPQVDFPWRVELSNFLSSVVPNLAWAALVYAAGVALQIAWARRAAPVPLAPPPVAPVAVPRAEPLHVPLDDDHLWKPR